MSTEARRRGAVLAVSACRSGVFVVQPRTFLELRKYLLELDLPESTKQAWEAAL